MVAPMWTWLVPVASLGILLGAIVSGVGAVVGVLCGLGVIGAVIAAVHHAEVVAHRVGEPFGTLVLALSVTVIEVSLILSMMLAGKGETSTVPRDTIYAAVMIICNGVVGICVFLGGLAHREQSFRVEGAGPGLAALMAMSALTLVLPNFTTTTPGGTYSTVQLAFVAVASLALWGVFVVFQTVRHRGYFLPVSRQEDPDAHAEPPGLAQAWTSFGLLLVSLVAVVGLAKMLSPVIEHAIEAAEAPKATIGIVIALLVLLPEGTAAVRAARADRLQTSMNLAIGSALASIGLTVPAVVVASVGFGLPLVLGLEPKDMALLTLTFIVSAVTLGTGRTSMMQGAVHIVIFAAFVCLAIVQ